MWNRNVRDENRGTTHCSRVWRTGTSSRFHHTFMTSVGPLKHTSPRPSVFTDPTAPRVSRISPRCPSRPQSLPTVGDFRVDDPYRKESFNLRGSSTTGFQMDSPYYLMRVRIGQTNGGDRTQSAPCRSQERDSGLKSVLGPTDTLVHHPRPPPTSTRGRGPPS